MKDWNKLYKHVSTTLKDKLPAHLTYHHPEHTIYVMKMAEKIAKAEKVSEEDILLIKTAALYHDIGFITGAEDHEKESIRIANKELPGFGYTDKEIKIISGMILATTIPQKPKTILEKILADADLEYLGTGDFKKIGDTLLKELRYFTPDLTREKWDAMQIKFLLKHHYYTDYCIQHRKPKKEMNLKQLIAKSK